MLPGRLPEHVEIAVVQLAHGLRQQCAIGARGRDAHLVIDQLGHGGRAHTDHRPAAGHGLQQYQSEGLGRAGVHQRVRRSQHARQFAAVAVIRDHADVFGEAPRFTAAHHQKMVALAETGEGIVQCADVLLGGKAPGIGQQAHALAQSQLATEAVVAPLRMKGGHIHAQRLQRHAHQSQ